MEINNTLIKLLNKYENDQDKLSKIKSIIDNIEISLVKDDINKEKKKQLDIGKKKIFDKFFEIYKNKYFYLKNLNVFYIYTNYQFKTISSDLILLKLKEHIPEESDINKKFFYKNLLDDLKKNHIFNITNENQYKIYLEKQTIDQVKKIFKKILGTMVQVDYVLNFLSKSINDDVNDPNTIIWYGDSAFGFLKYIKNLIIEYIRPCPKNIHTIKLSYNNYDLDKLNIVKFNNISFESIKEFKYYKPQIAITIFYYSNYLKPYKIKNILKSDIVYFQKYAKKELYLKKIIEENIDIIPNGLIKLKELYFFIKDFIAKKDLPDNIYSYNDIIDFMEKYYTDNIDSKHIYRGITLKELNKYTIFQEFASNNIICCNAGTLKLREVYEAFKVWFQKKYDYVSFPQRIDIKNYMDSLYQEHINSKENDFFYNGLYLKILNKTEILKKFLNKCTIQSENNYTKMQTLFETFKFWYGINYQENSSNGLYPNKEDIQLILSDFYKYEKYKGWMGLKIKNIFILNKQDITDIKNELNENYT